MSLKKIVIFASGSGSSAENIIINFQKNKEISIQKVYCNNKNAFVLERIKKYNINSLVFTNDDLLGKIVLNDLKNIQPDLIVLAGFLKKIPSKIINDFKNKIINIHPSLLPNHQMEPLPPSWERKSLPPSPVLLQTQSSNLHANEHMSEQALLVLGQL